MACPGLIRIRGVSSRTHVLQVWRMRNWRTRTRAGLLARADAAQACARVCAGGVGWGPTATAGRGIRGGGEVAVLPGGRREAVTRRGGKGHPQCRECGTLGLHRAAWGAVGDS